MKKNNTVGQLATDLAQKLPETRDPIELEREMHEEYEKNIHECIDSALKSISTDFFVIVITKKEPLLPNVIRNQFFWRYSCPTPDYDQTVYHYHRSTDELEFLWVIPSKDACLMFTEHALEVVESERELLKFVLDFADGTLYKLAKKLNGEVDESSALE